MLALFPPLPVVAPESLRVASVFNLMVAVMTIIAVVIIVFGIFLRMIWKRLYQLRISFQKVVLLVTIPKEGSREHDDKTTQEGIREDIAVAETFFSAIGGMKAERGLGIPCHAFIPADEAITLCHHADRLTYHGHSANGFTYGVEISGRCDFDSPSQITRARLIIAWWQQERLAAFPGAPCYIMAHRQSHWSRVRDPGPVIWRELGEWAIDELGMLEGPVVGDGSPIPADWR